MFGIPAKEFLDDAFEGRATLGQGVLNPNWLIADDTTGRTLRPTSRTTARVSAQRETRVLLLANEGPLTQGQLATDTTVPQRTVRNALETLSDAGLVTARPCAHDARKQVYAVAMNGQEPEQ